MTGDMKARSAARELLHLLEMFRERDLHHIRRTLCFHAVFSSFN